MIEHMGEALAAAVVVAAWLAIFILVNRHASERLRADRQNKKEDANAS